MRKPNNFLRIHTLWCQQYDRLHIMTLVECAATEIKTRRGSGEKKEDYKTNMKRLCAESEVAPTAVAVAAADEEAKQAAEAQKLLLWWRLCVQRMRKPKKRRTREAQNGCAAKRPQKDRRKAAATVASQKGSPKPQCGRGGERLLHECVVVKLFSHNNPPASRKLCVLDA